MSISLRTELRFGTNSFAFLKIISECKRIIIQLDINYHLLFINHYDRNI